MLAETFPQETPCAIALDGAADLFARDHAQLRFCAVRQTLPVGDEPTEGKPLALLTDAGEIAAMLDARGTTQALAVRRFSGVRHVRSNGRQAFTAVTTAVGERGLAALGRITVKKSVLTFAADL